MDKGVVIKDNNEGWDPTFFRILQNPFPNFTYAGAKIEFTIFHFEQ
jgi:hypothetical protein